MYRIVKNGNETISTAHINATMAFISLISARYFSRGFLVISDMEADSFVNFIKISSACNIEMKFENISQKRLSVGKKEKFLIMENPRLAYSKVFKTKPKLILVVLFTKEKNPTIPEFISKLVIPTAIHFFVIQITKDSSGFSAPNGRLVIGKSFRMYRPIAALPSKAFPLMSYGGENETNLLWNWEPGVDWNTFEKEIRDMRGITVIVGVASSRDKNSTIDIFYRNKNSFFWKILSEALGYTSIVRVEQVSEEEVKSMTSVYLKLLTANIDGLGVLPVLTTERNEYVDCIITGLDSKFHLMVRAPQYVHSWQSILKPLTSESWLCLGLAILFISIALRIVTYSRDFTSMDFVSCFLTIFGFVCGQGSGSIPKTLSARLVCYTALIFSFSIYQFYTSNFYSLLSTKEVRLPFTSLEQFLEKRSHHLYIHPDNSIYTHIKNARNGTFKRIWNEVLMRDPTHQLLSNTRLIQLKKFCEGTGAVLGLPYQIGSMNELECSFVAVNSGYFPTNIILAVKKNFPFKSQLQYIQSRLLEIGISHKFKIDYLWGDTIRTTKTNVTNEPVSLEHVAFLMVFYAVSVLSSFFVLAIEIITSKTFLKPRKHNLKKPLVQPKTRYFYLTQF